MSRMKKSILLSLITAGLLCSCGKNDAVTDSGETAAAADQGAELRVAVAAVEAGDLGAPGGEEGQDGVVEGVREEEDARRFG